MLQLSSLDKAFGERVLFDAVNWQIQAGDRVGLCGPNGAGKTTLLKMIAGLEEADAGRITKSSDLTVGYLPQDGLSHSGRSLFEEASSAFDELLALKTEMHDLEARLGDASIAADEHDRMLARYSEVQDGFRHGGGYDIELKVTGVLRGLGFATDDFTKSTEIFSGGWQMRIALVKLLLRRPRVLLLDEPTNHLDLDARNWLEEFLATYPHAVLVVSHDRYFLDRVVTAIAEVGLRTLTTFVGSYSDYLIERDARVERLQAEKKRQDDEMSRIQAFIDRFRYKASKAAQVQSRVKMLEKMTPIEVPAERKRVHFSFPACARSGRTVLELDDVSKRYGALTVFKRVSVHIERGDRLALVGPNGAGKSTLMRMLAGVETPDSGRRLEGHHLVTKYFAQDEATRLDGSLTVHDTLAAGSPVHMVPAIRNILGGFLFTGDDVHKKARVLSGGERTRLAVARMLLRPSNTLLLDEPTNHLDIDSTDVLLDALVDYGGTIIFVSHDRYFVERLATKVLEIGHGKAELYPGTYRDFQWSRELRDRPETPAGSRPAPSRRAATPRPTAPKPVPPPPAADHKRRQVEERRQRRLNDALKSRIDALERRISEREEEVRKLEATMATPGFYEDRGTADRAVERHQTLMWKVGDLMNQWEALQSETSNRDPDAS